MSNFFGTSIGKKFIQSITGIFLILFLALHLTLNLLLLFDSTGKLFNVAAHFMATNSVMRIMEPLLAIGFIIHILYASIITLQNQKARPRDYKIVNRSQNSTWASRNMYILGGLIFIFLVIHIINFFWKLKFGEVSSVLYDGVKMHDTYSLISSLFNYWWFTAIYVVGAIFLGLHLSHSFWSAFQTLGWSNDIWRKRLEVLGLIYTFIVAGGFAIIALYFFIF